MGFAETILLGAIAGSTIYLGLPCGRIERVGDRLRVSLAMFSVGVLAFIFMDVTSHGQQVVAAALTSYRHHHSSLGHVIVMFAMLAVGFTIGAVGISAAERAVRRRGAPGPAQEVQHRQKVRRPTADPEEGRMPSPDSVSRYPPPGLTKEGPPQLPLDQPVASHGSNGKGRPSPDRSDAPTARRPHRVCHRMTIDPHHGHQVHRIRTSRIR